MKPLKTLLTTVTLSAVAAGALLVAQTAPAHHGAHKWGAKMAATLNLTDQQKAQAKSIFGEARMEAKPVRQSLKQERLAIRQAVQAGKSPADIQAMAQSEGPQLAQLAGIRAAAMTKFYAILTPDQQQQFATARQQMHQRHNAQTPKAGE